MAKVTNNYYIRTDKNNKIINLFSDAFIKPLETDIKIGEGIGSQFRANKQILNKELSQYADIENGLPLINEDSQYHLEWKNGKIQKISDEVLKNEEIEFSQQPTRLDIIEQSQVEIMEAMRELYETMLTGKL